MTTATQSRSISQRSIVLRGIRWWTPGRLFTTGAWAVTLLILFYVVYLWFGERAWGNYKQRLLAAGEKLDWADFIPPAVPDDQNFAQIPLLAPLFDYRWDSNRSAFVWRDVESYRTVTNFAQPFIWPRGDNAIRNLTLPRIQGPVSEAALAERRQFAEKVLATLKGYEPVLENLRRAGKDRPRSRFNIHYEEGPFALLPHLPFLERVSHILQLRTAAELALGESNPALEDILLLLDLSHDLKGEPYLASLDTSQFCVQFAIQEIQDGLDQHCWSPQQLETLQTRLGTLDLLRDFEWVQRALRVRANQLIDLARETRCSDFIHFAIFPENPHDIRKSYLLARCLPQGWFYKNQVSFNQLFQDKILPGVNLDQGRVNGPQIQKNWENMDASLTNMVKWVTEHRFLAGMILFNEPFHVVRIKISRAQTKINQAAIACALERYRLANGDYPEQLNQLVPKFMSSLPHDLMSGEPFKYRRESSDRFILYSVGWNGKDDGGIYGSNSKGPNFRRQQSLEKKDDWAWQSVREEMK